MIGRNDPCWCGSGKKYKKCHMGSDRSSPGAEQRWLRAVKNASQIEGMRKAGTFNGEVVERVRSLVSEGTSTAAIDAAVHAYTVEHGHRPATLGYRGFPRSICTSINNIVCHGIPSESDILKAGDIINVDVTSVVDGFHGDSSETFLVGEVSAEAMQVVRVAARALIAGIEAVAPGRELQAVAGAIEPFVRSEGCSVVHQYTGHGVGVRFHENFTVYHHLDSQAEKIIMRPGMTFTVEPMINLGGYEVTTDKNDGWTVRTRDGSLSAQFEHTVLVTDTGVEVLTLTPVQRAKGVLLYRPELGLQ